MSCMSIVNANKPANGFSHGILIIMEGKKVGLCWLGVMLDIICSNLLLLYQRVAWTARCTP